MYFFYQNKVRKQGQIELKQNLRNNRVILIYKGLIFQNSMEEIMISI